MFSEIVRILSVLLIKAAFLAAMAEVAESIEFFFCVEEQELVK